MKPIYLTIPFCLVVAAVAATVTPGSLSPADKQFLVTAARTDMTEAHEGQLAEDKAGRTDVKAFAKTMVQDHTESYHQLSQLAAETGVSIPNGINSSKDATIVSLERLKGDSFDRQFTRDEIAAHRHAIAAFKLEAKQGKNQAVRDYATRMIPVLEKHLHLADDCAKPVKKS
jgi:putative membrane protein